MPLTNTQVSQSKPKEKDYRLPDVNNLYLLVKPTGRKYWRYDYAINGKRKTLAIGVYPAVSLKRAREVHKEAQELKAQGIDPSQKKQADALQTRLDTANTFQKIAELWIERKAHESKQATVNNIERCLAKDIYPYIGDTPISEITPQLLTKTLQRVEKRGSLETAKRLRQWCSGVFRYAIASGICETDPADYLKDVLKKPKGKHFPSVPLDEFPAYLKALELVDTNVQTKLANKLIMHTFVRHADLREATWEEFDLEKALWIIPADRKKTSSNGDHVIPLTPQVLEVLQQLKMLNGHRELLFPQAKDPRQPMSEGCLRKLIERAGYKGKMCAHGYRTIFTTAAYESGMFRREVIESQMHHAEKNKVVNAYNRAEYQEERIELMHWYSGWLDSQMGGNVVYPKFGSTQ